MERLNAAMFPAEKRPVKVLQFGEGNFLRAFVDYFIDIANEKTGFNGSVVLVKPITFGSLSMFHEQDCRYTVMLRGLVDGEAVEQSRLITSVSDAVVVKDVPAMAIVGGVPAKVIGYKDENNLDFQG